MDLAELIDAHTQGRAEAEVRLIGRPTAAEIRRRVGRAMLTRSEPGEMTAIVSVRLMQEALA